jgi:phosphate transport system substrate-binding protein
MNTRMVYTAMFVLALTACGRSDEGGSGGKTVQNKGSDTMVNLAQAWAEEYRKVKPEVAIAVSGGGSGTGIAALMNNTVDIANSSREMKAEEIDQAQKITGKKPVEHTVAYDAITIYLHPSNPMSKITRDQLACIYGEGGKCAKWTDAGVQVPGCANQEIVRVGRQSNSGTYAYFREWVVGEKGDFKLGSRDMQGSKDVVDLVAGTPCAIGYSGLGYKTSSVKTSCLATTASEMCVEPSIETAVSGAYPLSRKLYMYTLGEAQGDVAAYLDWIRSDAGQAIVERSGYAPLPKPQSRSAAP